MVSGKWGRHDGNGFFRRLRLTAYAAMLSAFFYADGEGYCTRQRGKPAGELSGAELCENIDAQLWAAGGARLEDVHYIAERGTRGELERALDERRKELIHEALKWATEKADRRKLEKELDILENTHPRTSTANAAVIQAAGAVPWRRKAFD